MFHPEAGSKREAQVSERRLVETLVTMFGIAGAVAVYYLYRPFDETFAELHSEDERVLPKNVESELNFYLLTHQAK